MYPKTEQVASSGNADAPVFAEALVRVHLPEYCLGIIVISQQWLTNKKI